MKLCLAILVCKLGRAVGRLVGKGSSLPGKAALKICPDILSRVRLPEHIIAVTGSNGKTSTVEMIAAILRSGGKTVVYNQEGSNQIEGVTTMLLCSSTLTGRCKSDAAVIESDERYAQYTFRYFQPTHYVITNLYRDQLTRNGHPQWVIKCIAPSIGPDCTLILNAADPQVALFARGRQNRVVWFGMDRQRFSTDHCTGIYNDGKYCPLCHAPMAYDYYHYNTSARTTARKAIITGRRQPIPSPTRIWIPASSPSTAGTASSWRARASSTPITFWPAIPCVRWRGWTARISPAASAAMC